MQGPWNTESTARICRESPARNARKQTAMTGRAEKKKWAGPRSGPLEKQTKLQESREDPACQSMTAITEIEINSPERSTPFRAMKRGGSTSG